MGCYIILNQNSKAIEYLVGADSKLAWAISKIGYLEYYQPDNPFAFLVDTIIGQMLSSRVADIVSNRLLLLCNKQVTPIKINNLGINNIKSIGISQRKAICIFNLADRALSDCDFFTQLDDETALLSI
jgi:DNA-3-methyladenine glycosylase II